MSEPVSSPTPAPAPRRRTLFIVAVALAAGLTGAVATAAIGASYVGASHGFGTGWHGGWRGGFGRAPLSPAEIEERAERSVRHLAIEIDATDEQQEKLAPSSAAVKDLMPLREKMRAGRQRAVDLLTAAERRPRRDRGVPGRADDAGRCRRASASPRRSPMPPRC